MREVDQGVPKIQQTLSAESPEVVAWRLSVTTVLSDMDAEIAAVKYTAQKTTAPPVCGHTSKLKSCSTSFDTLPPRNTLACATTGDR